MTKLDEITELIQKILELAARSDKPGEVEAAQAKAQQLILKYQIEEARLKGHTSSSDVTMVKLEVDEPFMHNKCVLLNIIAANNFCRVLEGMGYCKIYGYANDIEICIKIYSMISLHMLSELNNKRSDALKSLIITNGHQSRSWAASFLDGYCITIDKRLELAIAETMDSMSNDKSVALVVRNKQHAVEEYFQRIPRAKVPIKQVNTTVSGYSDGVESARLADLQQTRIE